MITAICAPKYPGPLSFSLCLHPSLLIGSTTLCNIQAWVTVPVHLLILAYQAQHTCMLIERDCTNGWCGWKGRWGGVTEEFLFVCCLSVLSPCLTAWRWQLTNASAKLGICSHIQYVGVRILSLSFYFLFFYWPHPSIPLSPTLFLNLPPSPHNIYISLSLLSLLSTLIFMFQLASSVVVFFLLASMCTSSSFLCGRLGHD